MPKCATAESRERIWYNFGPIEILRLSSSSTTCVGRVRDLEIALWRIPGWIAVLSVIALVYVECVPLYAGTPRDQLFDDGWLFCRADASGAEKPEFDDSSWRILDLPHDWSIEDLPPIENPLPQIDAVTGEWQFHCGDDSSWRLSDFDDSDWETVTLPENWERHSNYEAENAYGWFRRRLQIPEEFRGKDVELLLGRIDDVDEAWLNGTRIGGTGSFPPNYQSAWSVERRYSVPASLVRGNGADVLAVRVFDGKGDGGIAAAGMKSLRVGPFDPQLSVGGHFTGYTLGGIGWYRKHFRAGQIGSHIAIHFDGVYMNAAVWINGHFLGEHPHGYTSFAFDLTPHLNAPGEDNVIAVRVRNEGRNSRWYSGSGIYRHVWLTTTGPVHVPTHGLFVTTPEVSADKALVKLSVEICNAADAPTKTFIRAQVRNPQGRVVGSSEGEVHLVSGETRRTEQFVEFPAPVFWSVDSPHLYRAEVELIDAGKVVDTVATTFGIRTIAFGADQGFQLNGESLLLKGGCIHHDNGPLGAAAIDRAEERKVELLKANGFNAIRSAHNPPSSALLEACDRLGMLVIDEAFDQWKLPKENRSHG